MRQGNTFIQVREFDKRTHASEFWTDLNVPTGVVY